MSANDKITRAIAFADVNLNVPGREVVCGNKKMVVKKTSFRLLALLLDNADVVVSRKSIYKNVWGVEFDPGTKRIEVQLNYLRSVLLSLGSSVKIKTYRGKGLRLYQSIDSLC
ncbi:winged helix-turn-helix domain-containing protein [Pseudomonas asiatica]|uniref:winged helix-turn-helix domain-containing protein n=1 Tax=Pseudomonas asiatica TaxID=2219225 RepID=UPI003457DCD7